MREHTLYAKPSKCQFGIPRVVYLGHYISGNGVETDRKKIDTILQWPVPKNQKELRSFLGLTGYYRRFIKGYVHLCRPWIDLLKKDGFSWQAKAATAFSTLKTAMSSTPILALADFNLPFEIETDASSSSIGAVL